MRMSLNKVQRVQSGFCGGAKILGALLLLPLLSSCALLFPPAPTSLPPAQIPLARYLPQDQWHLIYLKDKPAGLSHFILQPADAGTYRIESFFLLRYSLMGLEQEILWKSEERVNGELDLLSFTMEGKQQEDTLQLTGEVKEGALYLKKEFRRRKEELRIPLKAPLKASLVQYFLPLLLDSPQGQTMTVAVFQFDAQDYVGALTVTVEEVGKPAGDKFNYKIKAELAGMSSQALVSSRGEVLDESMLGGLMRSRKVGAEQAKDFLAHQAMAKTDLLLDFSLVAVDKKIEHPEELKSLTLELQGVEFKNPVPNGRQKIISREGENKGSLKVKIERDILTAPPPPAGADLAPYLAATPIIQSRDPKIAAQAQEIVDKETDPAKKAQLLYTWVYQRLQKSFRESYTSREVLDIMEGECQSHAKLYAALARSAGLPAKVVSGLVYLPVDGKQGFLYHAWNEVYLGRWTAVDAALGQFPADVTHVKLAEGENLLSLAPLADTIGKLKIRIIEEEKPEP